MPIRILILLSVSCQSESGPGVFSKLGQVIIDKNYFKDRYIIALLLKLNVILSFSKETCVFWIIFESLDYRRVYLLKLFRFFVK
jgi:hypothetical protein